MRMSISQKEVSPQEEDHMSLEVSTNDFYAAAYYLLNGCELVEIEGNKVNGKIICSCILTGDKITELQLSYLNGKAEANILNLRRMVGQVSAWVHNAKKKFKNQLQQQTTSQGGDV